MGSLNASLVYVIARLNSRGVTPGCFFVWEVTGGER